MFGLTLQNRCYFYCFTDMNFSEVNVGKNKSDAKNNINTVFYVLSERFTAGQI